VPKVRVLIFVALPLLLADYATKRAAVHYLQPPGSSHRVLGDAVRLTLAFNRQAVMSLPVGPHGRWVLIGVTAIGLLVLAHLLRATGAGQRARAVGLALVIGGAVGNLVDRVASGRGVVDFIDVGVGTWRFWTFNVADVGIDVGAVLLAWALWRGTARAPDGRGAGRVADQAGG
jgi:signal peptidase II